MYCHPNNVHGNSYTYYIFVIAHVYNIFKLRSRRSIAVIRICGEQRGLKLSTYKVRARQLAAGVHCSWCGPRRVRWFLRELSCQVPCASFHSSMVYTRVIFSGVYGPRVKYNNIGSCILKMWKRKSLFIGFSRDKMERNARRFKFVHFSVFFFFFQSLWMFMSGHPRKAEFG